MYSLSWVSVLYLYHFPFFGSVYHIVQPAVLEGIVHSYLLTLMLFKMYMAFFLQMNKKGEIHSFVRAVTMYGY